MKTQTPHNNENNSAKSLKCSQVKRHEKEIINETVSDIGKCAICDVSYSIVVQLSVTRNEMRIIVTSNINIMYTVAKQNKKEM